MITEEILDVDDQLLKVTRSNMDISGINPDILQTCVDTVVPLSKGHSHQRTPPISDHQARFQMH
jgi:hypothetical protein